MSQQSFHQQTATGADINFTITTFSSDEILVYVDGQLKSAGVHYNINPYNANGQSTVDWIGTAPSSPSIVRIIRQTDVMNNGNTAVEGRATFQAGSSVKADDLNNNTKQVLRAIQELQDQKIQGYDLENLSITTDNIALDAVTNDQLANSIVAAIAANTAKVTNATHTGDVTGSTALTIANDAVTAAKLADSINAEIAANTAKVTNQTHTGDVTGSTALTIANNAVTTAKINDDAVTAAKLADSINTEIAANTAKDTNATHTGDVTGATSLTIASGAVTADKLGTDAVTTAKIQDDAVTAAKLADSINTEIAANTAKNTNVTTNLSTSTTTTAVTVVSSDGNNATIGEATSSAAGVMSTAHHDKLDGIEAGAEVNPTNAEIRTAVEAATDSNVFTDADHTKLNNAATLTDSQTLTNKTLTTPVINDFSGTAIVTSGTSTSDNKVYSAKRSDELYSTGASQAAASATAAANSATTASTQATNAASSATTASTQATNAAASASTATTQAATALTHLNTFKGQYLGALSSNPTADSLGNAVDQGDLYFNTTSENVRIFNGTAFQGISENSVDASRFATSDFSALYTASAGSNSINLGGLAISGAVFSNENIPGTRSSLSKGSATYNLGGL